MPTTCNKSVYALPYGSGMRGARVAEHKKPKGWLKRLFCGHEISSELRVEKYNAQSHIPKRHYRYCQKCDKRIYVD